MFRSLRSLLLVASQSKYEEAEQIFREVLEAREGALGKEHLNTLATMSNVAAELSDQGKYEEAEQTNQGVLAMRERVLGKGHPNTTGSISNLAGVLRDQGKYEKAE
jgi:tetratricopeptide (TPR) repeat protein